MQWQNVTVEFDSFSDSLEWVVLTLHGSNGFAWLNTLCWHSGNVTKINRPTCLTLDVLHAINVIASQQLWHRWYWRLDMMDLQVSYEKFGFGYLCLSYTHRWRFGSRITDTRRRGRWLAALKALAVCPNRHRRRQTRCVPDALPSQCLFAMAIHASHSHNQRPVATCHHLTSSLRHSACRPIT